MLEWVTLHFRRAEYMNEILFVVEEAPEGGLTARALGESIFTQGNTREELLRNIRDEVLAL